MSTPTLISDHFKVITTRGLPEQLATFPDSKRVPLKCLRYNLLNTEAINKGNTHQYATYPSDTELLEGDILISTNPDHLPALCTEDLPGFGVPASYHLFRALNVDNQMPPVVLLSYLLQPSNLQKATSVGYSPKVSLPRLLKQPIFPWIPADVEKAINVFNTIRSIGLMQEEAAAKLLNLRDSVAHRVASNKPISESVATA
jgi:hypothetical protein